MLPTLMLGDYSTSASSTPSYFLYRTDLLETRFSSHRYSTYFLLLFSFLDHHTGHPARHYARILLYECIFNAL
jgi:hypothetical protein